MLCETGNFTISLKIFRCSDDFLMLCLSYTFLVEMSGFVTTCLFPLSPFDAVYNILPLHTFLVAGFVTSQLRPPLCLTQSLLGVDSEAAMEWIFIT